MFAALKSSLGMLTLLMAALLAFGCSGLSNAAFVSQKDGPQALSFMSQPTQINSGLRMERWRQPMDPSHAIVLDERLRIIGGNATTRRLPGIKLPFVLDSKQVVRSTPRLKIGMLHGINTPEAHALHENSATHISSPVVVKLNGKQIKYLYTNVKDLEFYLPKHQLNQNGVNVLQIDAGYYFERPNQVAYDTIQFQNIAVLY